MIDVEHDTAHVPALISGQRTMFLGMGSVDAMFDFTNVGPDRVTGSAGSARGHHRPAGAALGACRRPGVDPAASRMVGASGAW